MIWKVHTRMYRLPHTMSHTRSPVPISISLFLQSSQVFLLRCVVLCVMLVLVCVEGGDAFQSASKLQHVSSLWWWWAGRKSTRVLCRPLPEVEPCVLPWICFLLLLLLLHLHHLKCGMGAGRGPDDHPEGQPLSTGCNRQEPSPGPCGVAVFICHFFLCLWRKEVGLVGTMTGNQPNNWCVHTQAQHNRQSKIEL
jgi:hypothetical protein